MSSVIFKWRLFSVVMFLIKAFLGFAALYSTILSITWLRDIMRLDSEYGFRWILLFCIFISFALFFTIIIGALTLYVGDKIKSWVYNMIFNNKK